jgi:hypothetical protein
MEDDSSLSENASVEETTQITGLGAIQNSTSQGMDLDRLLERVPFNERGFRTSIGSIGHFSGCCNEVCEFVHTSQVCPQGIYCNACHFSHGSQPKRVKVGKSKRDRYRKVKEELMNQIDEAPEDFRLDLNSLPECIARDERLTGKLLVALQSHQEEVRRRLVEL